jgi:hypothetical protein
VWSLAHLGEGEAVEFAREIVGAWLKTKNLETRWDEEPGGRLSRSRRSGLAPRSS